MEMTWGEITSCLFHAQAFALPFQRISNEFAHVMKYHTS